MVCCKVIACAFTFVSPPGSLMKGIEQVIQFSCVSSTMLGQISIDVDELRRRLNMPTPDPRSASAVWWCATTDRATVVVENG